MQYAGPPGEQSDVVESQAVAAWASGVYDESAQRIQAVSRRETLRLKLHQVDERKWMSPEEHQEPTNKSGDGKGDADTQLLKTQGSRYQSPPSQIREQRHFVLKTKPRKERQEGKT